MKKNLANVLLEKANLIRRTEQRAIYGGSPGTGCFRMTCYNEDGSRYSQWCCPDPDTGDYNCEC